MSAREFSVNHHVWVRLTDRGRNILRLNHEAFEIAYGRCVPQITNSTDADGWERWQLWELMQAFGAHMGNGLPVPFETTIRFEEPT